MARFRDQAICIRDYDWSETSQVVVLLTREHGKIRGLAKGSRRQSPSSVQRFSGGIGLLNLGEICGVTKPGSELTTITEWDLQNDFYHLRTSLRAQQLAMYLADITHAMLADHDAHARTFDALLAALTQLAEPAQRDAAVLRFQWTLLDDCGYRPELVADVHNHQPLPEQQAYTFDPIAGGLTLRNGVADWRVRRQTVQLLRYLAESSMDRTFDAAGDTAGIERANRLLCSYLRSLLDRQLPTMRFVLDDA